MKSKSPVILFFLLLTQLVSGIHFSFRHYKVESGLSENSVFCSLQDQKGFMWFGTKDGLNRFDGQKFQTFHHQTNDDNSIGNNFIRSLYEDKHNTLWVGTERGVYLYNYTKNSFRFFDIQTENKTPLTHAVYSICEDHRGNVWLGTDLGLYCYQPETKKIKSYFTRPNDKNSLPANFVSSVICDSKGTIWAGTLSGGLSKFIATKNHFVNFKLSEGKDPYSNSVLKIKEDSQGNLILGTITEGLVFFNRNTNAMQQYLLGISPEKIYYFRDIFEYSPGIYLIGSEQGLIYFDKSSNSSSIVKSSSVVPGSLSDNAVYSIHSDREGGIWVGTYFGGVNYLSPKVNPFELYTPLEYRNSVSGKAISQICEDEKGNLWIGTEDAGLNYFDTQRNSFKNFTHIRGKNSLSYHNVHSLLLNGEDLWVGTFAGGLNVLNTKTGRFRYYIAANSANSLSDNHIFDIYKDLTGTIWIGTINGLNRYNAQTDNFEHIPELGIHTHVYDILQDHKGLIWVGTYGRGVFCYNPQKSVWKQYLPDAANAGSLSHNKVVSVHQDDKKRLWFGTEGGGLCQYIYEKDAFKTYNTGTGLPNNVVYMVVSERDNLWLSTNKGLVCFNPDNNQLKIFTKDDGLQGDQFNFKSAYRARNGKIYFGGTNGFNAFFPDKIRENKFLPPVVITSFQMFNKKVNSQDESSPLKNDISYTDELVLQHNQSYISFEFVALSYCIPEKNQYAYKLEGLDTEWNFIGNERKITYTNLPPGKYTLKIKGSNNDGLWNEAGVQLKIRVLPPFWKSNWAILLYFVILILASYYTLTSLRRKHLEEQNHQLEKVRAEKEIELYHAKIDFFTNIAHEIRTPLSLIKAPLDSVMKKNKNPELKDFLSVINRNTTRLLMLVNQLLDFRKAEKNSYVVNLRPTNINELLLYLNESFKYPGDNKNLKLDLKLTEKIIIANIDAESLIKVLSNLLSNAVKHARSRIELILEEEGELFQIKVYDDGEGIALEEQEKIFQPFYQIRKSSDQLTQGTGIGLSLAKLLTELMSGSIQIDSRPNEFACFILSFPVCNDLVAEKSNHIPEIEEIQADLPTTQSPKVHRKHQTNDLPAILIVEDNVELNHYLTDYLKDDYAVFSAFHGVEAIKMLDSYSIDIIVTDIVMPEMDGLELCRFVKTNTLYSHIPVVILTARTDINHKIEGIETGADAYIEKPFSVEHLEAQIFNLLESREKLKSNFINSPLTSIKSIGKNKADDMFLQKITEIIENNILNYDFSVEELSHQINMSRSNLHRKVKGVSGLTPNDFIRLVKLKRAVKLMSEGETRINEICFMVGFNSPSYFAKCFQKQFGVLPKDFLK